MSLLNTIQLGDPVLRQIAQPLDESEFDSENLHQLINNLFAVMENKGGIGIAAPQLGVSKRIFVFGLTSHPVYTHPSSIPFTVLINPTIESLTSDMEEAYEGCLSVGTLRGKVPRCERIYYKGYDVKGRLIENEVEGMHARVVQHEYDHLNGIIFVDRVKDHSSLGFHNELVASGQLIIKKPIAVK